MLRESWLETLWQGEMSLQRKASLLPRAPQESHRRVTILCRGSLSEVQVQARTVFHGSWHTDHGARFSRKRDSR